MDAKDAKRTGWGLLWILDLAAAFVLIKLLGLAPALAMFAAHSLLKARIGYVFSLILSVAIGFAVFFGLVAILTPEGGGALP